MPVQTTFTSADQKEVSVGSRVFDTSGVRLQERVIEKRSFSDTRFVQCVGGPLRNLGELFVSKRKALEAMLVSKNKFVDSLTKKLDKATKDSERLKKELENYHGE